MNIFECGGKIPIIVVWCNVVEIRDACTETKFPPIPFIIGWKITNPLNESLTRSRTKPPNLNQNISNEQCTEHTNYVAYPLTVREIETNPLINNADKTGTHPDVNTFLVYLFLSTTQIQNGKIKK